jgi:hypothetical protein
MMRILICFICAALFLSTVKLWTAGGCKLVFGFNAGIDSQDTGSVTALTDGSLATEERLFHNF